MIFKIGDIVQIKSKQDLQIEFPKQAVFIEAYNKYGLMRIEGFYHTVYIAKDKDGNTIILGEHWCELVSGAKCTCNFYEREAYGCRCGRIVG